MSDIEAGRVRIREQRTRNHHIAYERRMINVFVTKAKRKKRLVTIVTRSAHIETLVASRGLQRSMSNGADYRPRFQTAFEDCSKMDCHDLSQTMPGRPSRR
jgi:hypothetical protein